MELEVTCKLGDVQYKKHFLGLSANVTYLAEQLAYCRRYAAITTA